MRIAFTFNLQLHRSEEQAEFDTAETVDLIAGAIEDLGHEVFLVDAGADLGEVVARLQAIAPDLVFNTAEGERGRGREALFPAIFEHLGLPYTGSDALTCAITLDKARTKQALAGTEVDVGADMLVHRATDLLADWNRYPCIVKPNGEGSSKGIDSLAVARDRQSLEARVAAELLRYPGGLLVEEYIEGVDLVVPYLEGLGALEPASYSYRNRSAPGFYYYERKLEGFSDLEVHVPARVSAESRRRAVAATHAVVDALDIRDVARLDFRLDATGRLVFLEVNALPSLEDGASLYLSGQRAGLAVPHGVIGAIIDSAARRYGIDARPCPSPRPVPRPANGRAT